MAGTILPRLAAFNVRTCGPQLHNCQGMARGAFRQGTGFAQPYTPAMAHPSMAIPSRPSRLFAALWWTILVSCIAIAVYATRYFFGRPGDAHFARYIFPLRLHIAGGMGALLAGPWQFSGRLRERHLELHRWLGRFYLLEVALGAMAGLAMSLVSEEGLLTHLGFGLLAVLWFFTGLQALRKILRRDAASHRRWMIRNFALTLAAVTLRNWMPLMLFALHWPFRASYITVSWLCWVPNLLVAEWYLRRRP